MKNIIQIGVIAFILLLSSVNGAGNLSMNSPEIISPIERELQSQSASIIYTWKHNEDNTSYYFSIYDRGLRKTVYLQRKLLAADICDGSICSYSPDITLTDKKMHRWYLRGYNDEKSSPNIFTDFYVGNFEQLSIPKALGPISSQTIKTINDINFSWNQDPSATHYTFFIYDRSKRQIVNKEYNKNVADICKNNICTIRSSTTLGESMNHAWYIRSSNGMEKSSLVTTYFNVITATPPSTPNIIYPTYNQEITENRNIEFSWDAAKNVDSYNFRIYDRIEKKVVFNQANLSKNDVCEGEICSYKPNIALKNSKNHVWYLRAQNGAGNSSFLSSYFHVDGTNLFTPKNFRVTNTGTGFIEMEWDASENATGYIFTRDEKYYQTVNGKTIFRDTGVEEGKIYNYRMSAYKDGKYAPTTVTIRGMATEQENPKEAPDNTSLPVDLKNEYKISFYDEFNGSRLNLSKWNTRLVWGPELIINNEEQYYVDTLQDHQELGVNPFIHKEGSLYITAEKTPTNLLSQTKNQKYTSGIITSRESFNFTHGYAEARVKIPAGQGLWPAFWLLNTKYDNKKPEIDIMENLGNNTKKIYQTYHYYDANGKLISNESHQEGTIDYSKDYHTFAVQWEPGLIQYYVDGVKTKKIEGAGVASQDMYVLANLAVGGGWAKPADATTEFPAQFAIDYIRVYEKK